MAKKSSASLTEVQYEATWDVLKNTTYAFKGADIPLPATILAVTDWLVMSVLALGEASGSSESDALDAIQRQLDLLEAWKEGKPPFDTKRDGGGVH